MLKFNPKRMFALRGIDKMPGFMVRQGLTPQQATRFLKAGRPMVKISHIERLCIALNCTPNELFEWKPDNKTVLPDSHSLNALDRGDKNLSLRQLVKDVPADKLGLIERFIDELKKTDNE